MKVVTTLPWIGSVAGEIGKDKIEITTLVKPSQDPHMIEAKPGMILAVRKADILMYNGLDLEIGYLPVLIESSRNPKVQPGQPGNFDCSRFVTVIEKPVSMDRSMGDVHPLGNPHYFYSANSIQRIVRGSRSRFPGSIRRTRRFTGQTWTLSGGSSRRNERRDAVLSRESGSSPTTSSSNIWPPNTDSGSWGTSSPNPASLGGAYRRLIGRSGRPPPTAS
jgi:hypothetical protein